MALEITTSQIFVENSDASTKFTGDDYVLYQKNYAYTGSYTFSSSQQELTFDLTFDVNSARFYTIFANVTAANGNASSGLVGYNIPLNGSVFCDLYYAVSGTTTYVDSEYISASCYQNYLSVCLSRIDYNGWQEAPRTSITMDLEVYLYDYGA